MLGSTPCLCLTADAWYAVPTSATGLQQRDILGIEYSSGQPWNCACSCATLVQTPANMASHQAAAETPTSPATPLPSNSNELSSINLALQLLSGTRGTLYGPSTGQDGQALLANPLAKARLCSSTNTGPSCTTPAAAQPNPPVTCPPAPKRPMPPVMLVPAMELLGGLSTTAFNQKW